MYVLIILVSCGEHSMMTKISYQISHIYGLFNRRRLLPRMAATHSVPRLRPNKQKLPAGNYMHAKGVFFCRSPLRRAGAHRCNLKVQNLLRADCEISAYTACRNKVQSAEQPSQHVLLHTSTCILNRCEEDKHDACALTSFFLAKCTSRIPRTFFQRIALVTTLS